MTKQTKGQTMNSATQLIKDAFRTGRMHRSLQSKGITLEYKLRTVSCNLRLRAGRLDNGTVTRVCYLEASGNTYSVRNVFKAHGFRWNRQLKVWQASFEAGDFDATAAAVLRALAN